ncbi:MAG TPA: four helix bundle protein [Holophagaceae bacterium]|nr:four helix bundle protein [Holophagaceae bacterium]
MFREPGKLKVFQLADQVACGALRAAGGSILAGPLCRAALRPPLAILEGCASWQDEAFVRQLQVARMGASELRYLLGLGRRVGLLGAEAQALEEEAFHLVKSLQLLLKAQRKQTAERRGRTG